MPRFGRAAALAGAAGLMLAAGTGVVLVRDSPTRLAGAEQLADPRGRGAGFVDGWRDAAGNSVDEALIGAASDLAGDDEWLYVLFDGAHRLDEGVLKVAPDGTVERSGMAPLVSRAVVPADPVTAVTLGREGEFGVSYGDSVNVVGFDMAFSPQDPRLAVVPEVDFDVGAIGIVDRFDLLLGSAEGGVIDRATAPDEQSEALVRRWLGGPDDPDAEVRTDEELGPVRAIVALDDGTVAFVAEASGGGELGLYVVDEGGDVTEVETGGVNPVAAEAVDTSDLPRRDRWPMAPISAGPDGRIVAVGEYEGHPRITLVDPGDDDGDVEVLADLEDVEPTVEERVSAAMVGDDLFFLAEGSLWKKAGVLGG